MPRPAAAVDYKAAVLAGLFAGLVFMMLEMIMVPLFLGGSPWGPPRMIAAIALGKGVLPDPPPPPTFDMGMMVAAGVVHFILSVVFAVVLALVLPRFSAGMALGIGAGFGVVLYLVNFYLVPAIGIFPWFAMARNWVSIFSHIIFGVLAAWAYLRWSKRPAVVT